MLLRVVNVLLDQVPCNGISPLCTNSTMVKMVVYLKNEIRLLNTGKRTRCQYPLAASSGISPSATCNEEKIYPCRLYTH